MPYAATNINASGKLFEVGDEVKGLPEEEMDQLWEAGALIEKKDDEPYRPPGSDGDVSVGVFVQTTPEAEPEPPAPKAKADK